MPALHNYAQFHAQQLVAWHYKTYVPAKKSVLHAVIRHFHLLQDGGFPEHMQQSCCIAMNARCKIDTTFIIISKEQYDNLQARLLDNIVRMWLHQ